MKKRVYRIVSVLCCLAMLLVMMPEKAKASADVNVMFNLPDVTFNWRQTWYNSAELCPDKGTLVKEGHGYDFTVRVLWNTGKTYSGMHEVEDTTVKCKGSLDWINFIPKRWLGTMYYCLEINCDGEISYSNIFSVTYTSFVSSMKLVKYPNRRYYPRTVDVGGAKDGYMTSSNFLSDGMELEVTIEKEDGTKTTLPVYGSELDESFNKTSIEYSPCPDKMQTGAFNTYYHLRNWPSISAPEVFLVTYKLYKIKGISKKMVCTEDSVNVRVMPEIFKDNDGP
ncbi:MAG: hypothetical protein J5531_04530 [Lachnospiraceae bacterium]|nr:hypothetical protein [Lachnospiraceae bacterium]